MLARDLVVPCPTVGLDTGGLEATRVLAESELPGLVVVDEKGLPYTVLPHHQVLRFLVPDYLLEDPSLARVYGEVASDELSRELSRHRVRDVLPERAPEIPVLEGDDTSVEIATAMARIHTPLVAVVENRALIGAVTAASLLERLIGQ